MKTHTLPLHIPLLEPVVRASLNEAAKRVGAAFGLSFGPGLNLAPGSERLVRKWEGADSAGLIWTMELVCSPLHNGTEAGDGWVGSILISRYEDVDLLEGWFVSYDEQLYGRKACKLTRERFCAWAATLELGSMRRETNSAVKPETEEVA